MGQDAAPREKKTLPLPGQSFQIDGQDAFVILPLNIGGNTPWVWYAPTLPGLPSDAETWMFKRFLQAGIAIAGIDAGESYGSPQGRQIYTKLYNHLTHERHFSRQPVLLARSRGGLMLYNWAAENADSVSAIAGIYPVCNLKSYPGIPQASKAYNLTALQLTAELAQHNPIDRLQPLAEAKIPVFHIHGDSDKVVPLGDNSAIIAERYSQLGGKMSLQVVPNQGHNMWNGWFQCQELVDFVIANAGDGGSSTQGETRAAIPKGQ